MKKLFLLLFLSFAINSCLAQTQTINSNLKLTTVAHAPGSTSENALVRGTDQIIKYRTWPEIFAQYGSLIVPNLNTTLAAGNIGTDKSIILNKTTSPTGQILLESNSRTITTSTASDGLVMHPDKLNWYKDGITFASLFQNPAQAENTSQNYYLPELGGTLLTAESVSVPTLQQVTDEGNSTTDAISTGGVGINTTTPEAILDVVSTTSGVLLPRLTPSEIAAITSSSQTGTLLFDSEEEYFQYKRAGIWETLATRQYVDSSIESSAPSLQEVTDIGNTTTDSLIANSFQAGSNPAGAYSLLDSDGSLYLKSNVSGIGVGLANVTPDLLSGAMKTFNLPNKSGTFAMLDDVSAPQGLQSVLSVSNTATSPILIGNVSSNISQIYPSSVNVSDAGSNASQMTASSVGSYAGNGNYAVINSGGNLELKTNTSGSKRSILIPNSSVPSGSIQTFTLPALTGTLATESFVTSAISASSPSLQQVTDSGNVTTNVINGNKGFNTSWDNGSLLLGYEYGVPDIRHISFQSSGNGVEYPPTDSISLELNLDTGFSFTAGKYGESPQPIASISAGINGVVQLDSQNNKVYINSGGENSGIVLTNDPSGDNIYTLEMDDNIFMAASDNVENYSFGFNITAGKKLFLDSTDPEFEGITGSSDFSANYTDNSFVQKSFVQNNFIPMTGTPSGTEITGDLRMPFDSNYGLTFEDEFKRFGFEISDYPKMSFTTLPDGNFTQVIPTELDVTIYGTQPTFQGLRGVSDYSANYTANAYIQKTYSDKQHSYYTTETNTQGKWVNNKPIYRKVKVYTGAGLPTDGSFDVSDIIDVDELISVNFLSDLTTDNGTKTAGSFIRPYDLEYITDLDSGAATLAINARTITTTIAKDMSAYDKVTIILEYTKTTD